MWYIWFLPLVLPRLALSPKKAALLLSLWVGAQVSFTRWWYIFTNLKLILLNPRLFGCRLHTDWSSWGNPDMFSYGGRE